MNLSDLKPRFAGPTGPTGAIGPIGVTGPTGPIGATGAGGTQAYWGSFWSNQDQSAVSANTEYAITLDNTDPASLGVSIVSGSQITFTATGVYSITFSIQFKNTDAQEHDADIWLKKNGINIPDTNSTWSVPSTHGGLDGHTIGTVNFVLSLTAGDYIQLFWKTDNTGVTLDYSAAASPAPVTPSVVVTATQVTYTQAGPTGATGVFVGDAATITTGTLGDARLSSNVTLGGNDFTGAGKIVRETSSTLLGTTTFSGSTVTTSTPVTTASQTWNQAGGLFTLHAGLVTDTASANTVNSASTANLIEYKVTDSVLTNETRFKVDKYGNIYFGSARSGQAPTLYFNQEFHGSTKRITGDSQGIRFFHGNLQQAVITWNSGSGRILMLSSEAGFAWSTAGNTSDIGTTADLILFKDAAGQLALRNSTNPQTFRVYNTFVNTTNYERGTAGWVSNVFTIGTEALGSGVARALAFTTGGSTRMTISATGDITTTNAAFITPQLNGYRVSARTITASSTLTSTDSVVLVSASAGNVVVTLPNAASVSGQVFQIKRTDGSTNTVSVTDPSSSIDGLVSININVQYTSVSLASNGTAYFII